MRCWYILIIFCELFYELQSLNDFKSAEIRDTSQHLLSRKKRWLVWKEGVNWVSVIFGIGIPVEVQYQSITLGMVMKAYYQLPNNSSYYTRPTIDYERKQRSSTRWQIYDMILSYLKRSKYADAKACLLKSICEVSAIPLEERSGLLAEIVHSILTPSSTDEEIEDHSNWDYHAAEKLGKEVESCSHLYPECLVDPIKQFTRFMTVIFGVGIPVNIQDQSITLGMLVKAYYQLPNNSSYYLNPYPLITVERKERSASRWQIYEMIENFLNRNKFADGKACLLKSICEVSAIPLEEKSGLLAEIVHSILTPSYTNDEMEDYSNYEYHAAEKLGKEVENCNHLYPECPIDPIGRFSRFMLVNGYV